MLRIFRQVLAVAITVVLCLQSPTYAQALLPNGQQQFVDATGVPLAGGSVYFYIPGTTTAKFTYQNSAGTVPNTNPVILNSAGRAVIWGSGSYRQIVYDAQGNLIWDQVTAGTPNNITCYGVVITATGICTVTGQTPGTATNDNASPGNVGEYKTQAGSGANPGTGVTVNIASITLTPGDWDLSGWCGVGVGAETFTYLLCKVGTTSSDIAPTPFTYTSETATSANSNNIALSIGPIRYSITTNTTVYLNQVMDYSGGTGSDVLVNGDLVARRMR